MLKELELTTEDMLKFLLNTKSNAMSASLMAHDDVYTTVSGVVQDVFIDDSGVLSLTFDSHGKEVNYPLLRGNFLLMIPSSNTAELRLKGSKSRDYYFSLELSYGSFRETTLFRNMFIGGTWLEKDKLDRPFYNRLLDLKAKGELPSFGSLTEDDFDVLWAQEVVSTKRIAALFGVSSSRVYNVRRGFGVTQSNLITSSVIESLNKTCFRSE